MMRIGKGWRNEPLRHSLASKGVKTGSKGYESKVDATKVPNPKIVSLSDTEIKRAIKMYDALYDLNSWTNYEFDDVMVQMNKHYLKKGYVFKLNDRTQKFELKKVDLL